MHQLLFSKAHTQSTNTNNNFIDKTEYYCWYAVNTLKISIFNALSIGSATMAAV